jgi:hypothetical protein
MSRANPGEGSLTEEAAEATSHAASQPTPAPTVIATRRRFNPASDPKPQRELPGGETPSSGK